MNKWILYVQSSCGVDVKHSGLIGSAQSSHSLPDVFAMPILTIFCHVCLYGRDSRVCEKLSAGSKYFIFKYLPPAVS